MILADRISTPRLTLRTLQASDATSDYLGWLKDPRVNANLELRFQRQDLGTIRRFIEACNDSPADLLLGAFGRGGAHIGNVRLGPINVHHQSAPIGFLIGDPGHWGRGLATEMIEAVVNYAFARLGLQKIWAGCYSSNVGSYKAMSKAGLVEEGVQRSHCVEGAGRVDLLLVGITRERWIGTKPQGRKVDEDV